MPNNFKLRGDYYVSKAGNDSNAGTSPDAPLLTVQAALDKITTGVNKTIIIGSGVYKEAIYKNTPDATFTISVIADGYVVFEGNSGSNFNIFCLGSTVPTIYLIGIEIRGYNLFNISGGLGGPAYFYFTKCVFKNNILFSVGNAYAFAPRFYFDSTIFINCTTRFTGSTGVYVTLSYDKCIFINSSFDYFQYGSYDSSVFYNQITNFRNNYVDQNSLIRFRGRSYSTTGVLIDYNASPGEIINNNFQGKVVFPWTGSVSGINTFNVPISLAQAKIDYPTYFFNSFSADPKFNNPRLLDFTLQLGSPNMSASTDFSNIGGTQYAVTYTASSAAFTTNATSQSLDYRGLYYGISGSAVSGSITSGPMFLQWPRVKPMTSINWMGALDFNKTITASFAGNTNVPAYTTYTSASGQAGANPDRLKIAMRFSTQQTQPSTDAEWDNNGYWTAGTYQLFEINQKPTIDYKGTGNGDPTYVETSAIGDLVPSWVQTEIILRNDYNR